MITDKQKIRDMKTNVALELQKINVQSYRLKNTDQRLSDYVLEVICNPSGHNLYELLAVKRFFDFLDKYEFRPVEVKKIFVFYENLIFTGPRGYTYYKLTNVQAFQFANIFGFYRPDGRRLIRDALLFVPRKFSKTTGVAAIAINDLLFGDMDAQSYVAANSYDQALICFNIIRGILKAHDKKMRHFKINREKISNLQRGRSSFARCLSSDADKLDGLNASTVIVDEYSQADTSDLKDVLTSSMGTRLNPLTVVITTASKKINGPFFEMLNAYKAILSGEIENDAIFAHIFEPDIDDEEGDPATWKKVQPHMGITVQNDFYEYAYHDALLTKSKMLDFRTRLLNIFAQDKTTAWYTQDEIFEMMADINIDNIQGKLDAFVSVDLSVRDDFSAVGYTVYDPKAEKMHTHIDYYFPKGALADHPNREIYEKWAKEGHLILVDGDVIDYKMIVNDILRRGRTLNILKIGYDPYKSLEFVNLIIAYGGQKNLEPVSQTYGTFTSPIESFELAKSYGRLTFSRNPITAFCFGNAVLDEDKMENRKPLKRSQYEKIDGVIVTLMNLYLSTSAKRKL